MAVDRLSERLAARPPTVGAMLVDRVQRSGPREAFRYLEGERWVSLTWAETKDRVDAVAAGLLALGVQAEDRVAIASGTRMEWILADLAIMSAGAATTTVYPNTAHADVAFILTNSRSTVIITEDDEQTAKVLDHRDELTGLLKVVQIDGRAEDETVIGWNELVECGRTYLAERPDAVDEAIARTTAETLSTLIYTSGTTGRPKGVRLLHSNWTYESAAIDELNIIDDTDVQYLWLPLSHVFGKLLVAVQLQIGFTTAVDGGIDKIVDNLGVVRPTFMAGAPRIFEKVRARVMLGARHGLKGQIFARSFAVGEKTAQLRLRGEQPKGLLAVQQAVAEKLVFSKIKARMGGRVKFFVSGSAPLSRDVQEWFYAAGLTVIEGYGLTETTAAAFVNDPFAPRFGTVGPPVPGTEVRIAEDGEIWVRGKGVMDGYHELPEASAEALQDGWFATGDIGELDDEGYLKITDRKKDLIKTSGGKYVAPQKVEAALKTACPYLSNVLVVGDGRKYISAVVTLDEDAIGHWAAQNGHGGESIDDLATSAEVKSMIEGYVKQANGDLERWETVKRFAILEQELSVDSGEVTPSMKIRRKAVEKNYADVIDGLYDKD